MNEEPILNLNKDEKSHSKNKAVGRISRLFQKKPKKKSSMAPSISSICLSEEQQSLSNQSNYHSSSSIASSHLSTQQPQQQYIDTSDRNSYLDTRSIQLNNDNGKINICA
jgi:hypothetical protein